MGDEKEKTGFEPQKLDFLEQWIGIPGNTEQEMKA
jgi:hypothetical protein